MNHSSSPTQLIEIKKLRFFLGVKFQLSRYVKHTILTISEQHIFVGSSTWPVFRVWTNLIKFSKTHMQFIVLDQNSWNVGICEKSLQPNFLSPQKVSEKKTALIWEILMVGHNWALFQAKYVRHRSTFGYYDGCHQCQTLWFWNRTNWQIEYYRSWFSDALCFASS